MSRGPSTDLFDLIKSLTKSEKRTFKLYASRHRIGGRNAYVELFDAIDRQTEYCEESLVRDIPRFRKSDLRSMKSYLYDLILRSLRFSLVERSVQARLQYQIDKAEILIDKGLYTQAMRLLARTGKLARKEGYLIKELEILLMEQSLNVRVEKGNTLERHGELHRRRMDVLHRLDVNSRYYDLFMRMHCFQLKTSKVEEPADYEEMQGIMQDPYLLDEDQATTFFARMYFHEVHLRYCILVGDHAGALEHTRSKLALLDGDERQRELRWYEYVYTCGSFLILALRQRQFIEFEEKLDALKRLRENNLACVADLEVNIHYAEIAAHIKLCRFEETGEAVAQADAMLERFRDRIETSVVLSFYISFALLTLRCGDVAGSISWIEKILGYPMVERYARFADEARLLGLVAYYEFGETRLFESRMRSLYRALSRKKDKTEFERLLLRFFARIVSVVDRGEQADAFAAFYDDLCVLKERLGQNAAMPQFDLLTWVESKVQGVTFTERLREKLAESMAEAEEHELVSSQP